MNPFTIAFIIFGLIIGALLGALLAVTKVYSKQVLELTRALMAKNLTDYTVNTAEPTESVPEEESDIIPTEEMTDEEFDHTIKEQLNG